MRYHQAYQHMHNGSPRKKEERKAERTYEEAMAKTFSLHIQEVQQTPSMINSKKSTLRHIVIKVLKNKERIPKVARSKRHVTCTGATISLTADFLSETMEARRQQGDILNALKKKKKQSTQNSIFKTILRK